jgi:hypothetical protein
MIIISSSDLLGLMTTKPQKSILIILFFKKVITNIKTKSHVLKLRSTSAEKLGFSLLMQSNIF